jgi:hypothetical protein
LPRERTFLPPKNEGSNDQVISHASRVTIIGRFRLALLALSVIVLGGILAVAMVAAQTPAAHADESVAASLSGPEIPTALSRRATDAQPNEHPLMPVLRWAQRGLPAIERLKDYSATLVRRERIHGKLSGYEYATIKIRHEPFSVYIYFRAPASVKGQEVVYIAGRNQGKLLAHKARLPATVALDPEGLIAMSGRHYPLTEIGLVNLVRRLVEVGQEDAKRGECEVKYFTHAKVNDRVCTVIQVVHPTPRDYFRFHLARVFVDDELTVPIRYESHDWPRESGGKPELIEEYTYLDLKLNNGFTDADFNARNPVYHFHPAASEPDRREESQ